jgi:hypothetical protein
MPNYLVQHCEKGISPEQHEIDQFAAMLTHKNY